MTVAPVDQAVRDDVRSSLDANLCVEAGAGTGKTTVLVDRIVELLARGRATVDGIAVITFTEKAAGELAARVRQRLEERRAETFDPDELERLDRALAELQRAHIETIHAFAASLLRERPVEAGLDPQFEVLDGVAAEVDFDRAYRDWVAQLLQGEHPGLQLALHRGFDLRELRETAVALHTHRYLLPLSIAPASKPDARGFVERLETVQRELESLGGQCHEPDDDPGYPQIALIAAFAEACRETAGDLPELERTVLFRAPWLNATAGRAGNWGDGVCAAVKELVREVKNRLDALKLDLRTEALVTALPLVEGFVAGYAVERRREGRANFDDLLIWTRDLLRDDVEARDYFRRRFTHLLVDEFQDTDPIQAELVAYLVSPEGSGGFDWTDLRPSPGKLVVVGDPKQSIYRFRRADIAIYDEVKAGMLAGGERVIVQNFRSLHGVLDWLNAVFDRVLEPKPRVQPANVPLVPAATELELDRPSVVTVRRELGEVDSRAVRTAEAEALARIARRAVKEECWKVRDRQTKQVRHAEWRDVALLFPWRTDIELYEEALTAAGVPFRHEGSRGFNSRQEVRDLVSVLLAVDDPADRINLVAALRSAAFGCSDEEIFLFSVTDGTLDYRAAARGLSEGAPAAVAEAMEILDGLHRERRGLSLPELVRRVIERTRMVEVALALPGGDQAAANLLKLADQARAFSASEGGGLRAFAQWLAVVRDEESPEADAVVAEETDDAVRVMTIHAAKGLEFPIVGLANLNTGQPNRHAPIPDAAHHRLHLRVGTRYSGPFETPGYAKAREDEKALAGAELRRWLYVAATRARDHLIVPIVAGKAKPGPMLEALVPDLPSAEAAPGSVDGHCFVYDPALVDEAPPVEKEADGAIDDAQLAAAGIRRDAFVTELEGLLRTGARERRIASATAVEKVWERPLAEPIAEDGSFVVSPRGPALEIGDAVHRVLELVDLPAAANLDAVARAVCAEGGVEGHLSAVAAMARRCLESATVRRALASGSYHREVAFMVAGPNGSLASGRVDLVFRVGGELAIVDYKTDTVAEAAVDEHIVRHREQAALYAHAVARSTGLVVSEVVFVFARPGVERAFTADQALLELGEALASPPTDAVAE